VNSLCGDLGRFLISFLICYLPQLLFVNLLNKYAGIQSVNIELFNIKSTLSSSYICQLCGIIFYTILNFTCNKYYTFKQK
jgi:putative flippase GtrA